MVEDTIINLKKTTRDRLKGIGRMDQSYDDVISEIVNFWDANHSDKWQLGVDSDIRLLSHLELREVTDKISRNDMTIIDVNGKLLLIEMKPKSKKKTNQRSSVL